jgi:mannose-6-phosphate isomerase-like protein (cupin superfamily)
MKKFFRILFLILVVTAINTAQKMKGQNLKLFRINELSQKNSETPEPFYQFLNEESFSSFIYELPANAKDEQTPHKLDEVYYVQKGVSEFSVDGKKVFNVKPGSVIYVKAGVEHRFTNIKEDLQIIVLFSKKPPKSSAPDWKGFQLVDLQKVEKKDENVWNKFLTVPTMLYGLYLLPDKLNGDKPLVHKVDEINIVVKGSGKFKTDDEDINVSPGLVFCVKAGTHHNFYDLDSNMQILILFQNK